MFLMTFQICIDWQEIKIKVQGLRKKKNIQDILNLYIRYKKKYKKKTH